MSRPAARARHGMSEGSQLDGSLLISAMEPWLLRRCGLARAAVDSSQLVTAWGRQAPAAWRCRSGAPAGCCSRAGGQRRQRGRAQRERPRRWPSHCAARSPKRASAPPPARRRALASPVVKSTPKQPRWVSRTCGTATPRSTARAAAPGEARTASRRLLLACQARGFQGPRSLPQRFCPLAGLTESTTPPPRSRVCGNGGGIIRKYGLNSEFRGGSTSAVEAPSGRAQHCDAALHPRRSAARLSSRLAGAAAVP